MVYDGPRIRDEVNPTQEEIRAWAYSDAFAPMQDWDIIIAEPEHLDVLLDLVGDSACPSRSYLLGSLYCLIGHSDHADPRVTSAASKAATSSDPWVSAWGHRAEHVFVHREDFKRDDWCGWQGFRADPDG